MNPSEVSEAVKLYEFLMGAFGASSAPLALMAAFYISYKGRTKSGGDTIVTELKSELRGIRDDISDVSLRVARIEGKLDK